MFAVGLDFLHWSFRARRQDRISDLGLCGMMSLGYWRGVLCMSYAVGFPVCLVYQHIYISYESNVDCF